jgi:hypothetical protein
LPGGSGGLGVAGGVMGVAEVGEGVGFVVAVADVPVPGKGLLVAGHCMGVVAEVVVGVAEAVPGGGLPVAVAELLEQGEGLLAMGERLLMVAGKVRALAGLGSAIIGVLSSIGSEGLMVALGLVTGPLALTIAILETECAFGYP